jgi:hypothetical protein
MTIMTLRGDGNGIIGYVAAGSVAAADKFSNLI